MLKITSQSIKGLYSKKFNGKSFVATPSTQTPKPKDRKQSSIEESFAKSNAYVEPYIRYDQQASYWKQKPKNLESMANDTLFREPDYE